MPFTLNKYFSYFFRISRKFEKCVTFRHVTFQHDSVVLFKFLELRSLIESHSPKSHTNNFSLNWQDSSNVKLILL